MANTSWTEMMAIGSRSAQWILKNIAFVLFLSLMVLVDIANARYGQRTIREIEELKKTVQEQGHTYNALSTEIMNSSKKSEIARRVKPLSLELSNRAPKKIVVKDIETYGKE
ncbi:MAG: FtsL-like putative cell division protein [Bacteroidota bacterium]